MISKELLHRQDKERLHATQDNVRTYLTEIGRIPLLTHEQEFQLGKQVQQLMLLLEAKKTLDCQLRREPTSREWATHVQLSEAELAAIAPPAEEPFVSVSAA